MLGPRGKGNGAPMGAAVPLPRRLSGCGAVLPNPKRGSSISTSTLSYGIEVSFSCYGDAQDQSI